MGFDGVGGVTASVGLGVPAVDAGADEGGGAAATATAGAGARGGAVAVAVEVAVEVEDEVEDEVEVAGAAADALAGAAAGARRVACAEAPVAAGAGGGCSMPASAGNTGKGTKGRLAPRAGGGCDGSRCTTVIGVSTPMGLGWVSNSSGNVSTPSTKSTRAPTKRRRARVRAPSTEPASSSAAAGGRADAAEFLGRRKGNCMRRYGIH